MCPLGSGLAAAVEMTAADEVCRKRAEEAGWKRYLIQRTTGSVPTRPLAPAQAEAQSVATGPDDYVCSRLQVAVCPPDCHWTTGDWIGLFGHAWRG